MSRNQTPRWPFTANIKLNISIGGILTMQNVAFLLLKAEESNVTENSIFNWFVKFCMLSKCCRVRLFLPRLIDLTRGIRAAHNVIRLSTTVKADLRMWDAFLGTFNGRYNFQRLLI